MKQNVFILILLIFSLIIGFIIGRNGVFVPSENIRLNYHLESFKYGAMISDAGNMSHSYAILTALEDGDINYASLRSRSLYLLSLFSMYKSHSSINDPEIEFIYENGDIMKKLMNVDTVEQFLDHEWLDDIVISDTAWAKMYNYYDRENTQQDNAAGTP